MDKSFDLVVIGTGAAASTVASRCREAGWSVAIVDELPYGGTCQLRGCDPKKVLRRGAEVVDAARLLHGSAPHELRSCGSLLSGRHVDSPAFTRLSEARHRPPGGVRMAASFAPWR